MTETYMRNNKHIVAFAQMVSTKYMINYISVLDMIEIVYKDTMKRLANKYAYRSNEDLIESTIVETIVICDEWLQSDFHKEIKASHLCHFSLPYLFFNVLTKDGDN